MYFVRKKDRKGVARYVFVYEYRDGKNVPLPRKLTKHLDGEPDHNVQHWIDQYMLTQGIPKPEESGVLTDPKFKRYVDQWLAYLEGRGRDPNTIRSYRQVLQDYVVPFFLAFRDVNDDPNNWVQCAPQMLQYLEEKGATRDTIRVCNTALRGFWTWLGDEGITIHRGSQLRLRNPPGLGAKRRTKLKVSLKPQDVIAFAQDPRTSHRARLMALVGYFFSLRPQELFALERKYFRAGTKVLELETAQVLKRHKLDHRLAYRVQTQRSSKVREKLPKEFSVGWVTCFWPEAAELIVKMLDEFPREGWIFPATPDRLYRYWRDQGRGSDEELADKDNPTHKLGVTLKDLRRASLTWLGHHTTLPGLEIQKIARHADFESTQIYLRRPDQDLEDVQETLDLGA